MCSLLAQESGKVFTKNLSHKETWEQRVHITPNTKNTLQLLHYIWPAACYFVAGPHAVVVGVFCHLPLWARDGIFSHVFSAEFSSVLLLEQILRAFCQISRHVSAVICTLKSFPRICLVACVITQVVAIRTDANILKRKGCLCVLRFREWPIKLNWASKNEGLVKVECFFWMELGGTFYSSP